MKKLLLLLSIAFFSYSAKAQWVIIPDSNFAMKLQIIYPTCVSGNYLDTVCAASATDTSIYLDNGSDYYPHRMRSIWGIQYFTNLKELWLDWIDSLSITNLPPHLRKLTIEDAQIDTISNLPNSLLEFFASSSHITTITSFPNNLTLIDIISDNTFASLPPLPQSLRTLDIESTALISLPALPPNLQMLYLPQNHLASLPALPASLLYINLEDNPITTLPSLPPALINLNCDYCLLNSLPVLPNTLKAFSCYNNHLTSLPLLPNCLEQIFVRNNQLTSLPTLPNNLLGLDCTKNQLTSLPPLPNTIISLWCDTNNIACFPPFPTSLSPYNFSISSNPFTCLPNYVAAMDSLTLTFPLCQDGNTNGCPVTKGILGYTYRDVNSDCSYNFNDSAVINVREKIFDSNNNLIAQTISAMNGVYNFPVDTGIYSILIDTLDSPYTVHCVFPGIDSMVNTTLQPFVSNVNFPITCKPGFDVGVQSIVRNGRAFPGQPHTLRILAGDMSNWYNLHCANGTSGQVMINVSGPVTFSDVATGAPIPSIVGNTFTYNIADFGNVNINTAFGLVFTTNTTAQSGDQICVTVTVTPTAGDNDTSNNTYNYCYTVVNSYDPNYKETYPETVAPAFDDYFTYTIHFQNTGTAAAINIHLADTLDANLDVSTFQVINYSHYNTTWLTGNKLSVNFPNIQLPDSTIDFNASQGFIQYRIKPLANLPAGTQIHNRASIYFDFNAPVVTNTTTNEFMLATGNSPISDSRLQIALFPNPTSGTFEISSPKSKIVNLKIYNVLGECVYSKLLPTGTKSYSINSMDFAGSISSPSGGAGGAGIYFVQIQTENGIVNRKVIKE